MTDQKDYGSFNPDNKAHEILTEVIDNQIGIHGKSRTPDIAAFTYCRIYGLEPQKDSFGKAEISTSDKVDYNIDDGGKRYPKVEGKLLDEDDEKVGRHSLHEQNWNFKYLRYNLIPYALKYMEDELGMVKSEEKAEGGKETKYWKHP